MIYMIIKWLLRNCVSMFGILISKLIAFVANCRIILITKKGNIQVLLIIRLIISSFSDRKKKLDNNISLILDNNISLISLNISLLYRDIF